ncbi:hypothetical protein EW146_g3672 [Bondarzewia mesenterica]|uniref:Uncharacterized protein n=1 Tax=Bondarzewia mesenterica TaxID=1095465 RepID=A0A4S4LWW5_9AGAM|nr:hypothetical protein EW146_g3672 [Bondarzewia mesenterica]
MSARAPFLPSRPASRAAQHLAASISGQAKISTGKDSAGNDPQASRTGRDDVASNTANSPVLSRTLNTSGFRKGRQDSSAAARPPSRNMHSFEEKASRGRSPTHWPEIGIRIHAPRPTSPLFANNSLLSSNIGFKAPALPMSAVPFSRSFGGQNDTHISTADDRLPPKEREGSVSPFRPNALLSSRIRRSGTSLESIQEVLEDADPDVSTLRGHSGETPTHALKRVSKKRAVTIEEGYGAESGGHTKRFKPDVHDSAGLSTSLRARGSSVANAQTSHVTHDHDQQQELTKPVSFFGNQAALASGLVTAPSGAPQASQGLSVQPLSVFADMFSVDLSEADLERYVEKYEHARQRWIGASLEEYAAGEGEIMTKIENLILFLKVKDHIDFAHPGIGLNLLLLAVRTKRSCFDEINKKLADQHAVADERARALRTARESYVRSSGDVVGGLGLDLSASGSSLGQ